MKLVTCISSSQDFHEKPWHAPVWGHRYCTVGAYKTYVRIVEYRCSFVSGSPGEKSHLPRQGDGKVRERATLASILVSQFLYAPSLPLCAIPRMRGAPF